MRKLRTLGLIVSVSFIAGCSAVDELIGSEDEVSVTGTWDYSYKNSRCGDLEAQGIEIVESNNGDTSQVGNIHIDGTMLMLDNTGNCYLGYTDYIDTSFVGTESDVPEPDYMNNYLSFFTRNVAQSYIKSSTIHSFTPSLLSFTLNHDDGTTSYLELTKQQS